MLKYQLRGVRCVRLDNMGRERKQKKHKRNCDRSMKSGLAMHSFANTPRIGEHAHIQFELEYNQFLK